MQNQSKPEISKKLLAWYHRYQRNLPWRRTGDPYRIWVSEIMLQQTQVDTVIPFYQRFIKQFPTISALARASLDEVLKLWENMGYYSRARHLHAAARIMVTSFHGRVPDDPKTLLSLPGIGPYTAGAILSMAFDQPTPAIDGNVRRVISRVYALTKPIQDKAGQARIAQIIQAEIPARQPGSFNQALMDLGALICTPRKPSCGLCPLMELCRAKLRNQQHLIPRKGRAAVLPHRDMVAGLLYKNKEVLIVKRPETGLLGGLWRFPGCERTGRQSLPTTLGRYFRQELGLEVEIGPEIFITSQAYTHFRMTLHVFLCGRVKGRLQTKATPERAWAALKCLPDFAFAKADREVAGFLQALQNPSSKHTTI